MGNYDVSYTIKELSRINGLEDFICTLNSEKLSVLCESASSVSENKRNFEPHDQVKPGFHCLLKMVFRIFLNQLF